LLAMWQCDKKEELKNLKKDREVREKEKKTC
jgi:hypothetical protein